MTTATTTARTLAIRRASYAAAFDLRHQEIGGDRLADVGQWLEPDIGCGRSIFAAFPVISAALPLEADPVNSWTVYHAGAMEITEGDIEYGSTYAGAPVSVRVRLLPSLRPAANALALHLKVGALELVLDVDLIGSGELVGVDTGAVDDSWERVVDMLALFHPRGMVDPIDAIPALHVRACVAALGGVEPLLAAVKRLAKSADWQADASPIF